MFDKLCKYKDDDVWTVRFNIADRKYSVYSPGQDLVGSLPSDFTYTYGGYRNICGKNTGHTISWRKRFGMNICEAELTLSIYEIDQV